MEIAGWGRYPRVEARISAPRTPAAVARRLAEGATIARGMGRSYGDSALAPRVMACRGLDHFLSFDDQTGVLRCAAGVTLDEVVALFVPRGWFPMVTPGTRFVTVGGAVAADVHGKNHHRDGSFCDHLLELTLMLADGEVVRCSPEENAALFHATCGGMGLTGVILEAAFRLRPIRSAFIRETVLKAANLGEALALFEAHDAASYSVAWIDCLAGGRHLGRSLIMLGEHDEEGALESIGGRPLSVPLEMPAGLLNRWSVGAFNTLYYHRVLRRRLERRVHFAPYFYPLDGIRQWNHLYGRAGFLQYQFVLPKAAGMAGVSEVLERIARSGRGSFLAVLKSFGRGNRNLLSFPMEGYTLAVDLKREAGVFELLDELDRCVVDHGGRIYLAKDARMGREVFRQGYPEWEAFAELREQLGAAGRFRSLQSERLGL